MPNSLTDPYISGNSSLVPAQRYFCSGMAHCFELIWSKMANYVIILWSMMNK